jgi:hypothetical protein
MSRRRGATRIGLLAALAVMSLLASAPSAASADVFGSISLASASTIPGFAGNQQADFAHDAAISGNGRFVAFDGSFGGRTGTWRRDLQTGAVSPVAAEDPGQPTINAPDADLPSISADGRYVSFTTTAPLDRSNDANPGPDVYVRDMTMAPSDEGAYTLASAVNGSAAGLTYEPTSKASSIEFEEAHYGSVAAGRSALSADGRTVAFVTTAISNLAGAGTPALQVAVRHLDSVQTQLVSVARDPATAQPIEGQPVSGQEGAVTYGAVFTGSGAAPIFVDPAPYEPVSPVGASISADGSTVAWMAVNVPKQAGLLSGEAPLDSYTEPLWRRIGDGPGAPIRRITGGSDPSNQGCLASGETSLPGTPSPSDPCQGPFAATQEGGQGVWRGGSGDPVPRLSADGYTVVFLANAPLVSQGPGVTEPKSDLYLVNMREALSRGGALRPLTELAGGNQQDIGENGPIEDLAISPDGRHVAFTTKRTVFPLGSPAYVSAPASVAGMLELFDVNLANDTLTRVSEGFAGGPSEHPHSPRAAGEDPYTHRGDGALSPSYSSGGETLAFSSTASNLAFGDGNTPPLNSEAFDGSDAFVATRVIFGSIPTPQSISPDPAGPSIGRAWRLGVTARRRADGTVLLYVTLPGAGTLHAGAQSSVGVRVRRHGRFSRTVATRTVAAANRIAPNAAGGLITLKLSLASSYRVLASKRPGLAATITVTFLAARHATQRKSVQITFLRTAASRAKANRFATTRRRSAAAGGRRGR